MQASVPSYVWEGLTKLHAATGTRFILSVNFKDGDVNLSRMQVEAAQRALPRGSIYTFELGNEPNLYENKSGNGLSASEYTRKRFIREWSSFAANLSCPSPGSCTYNAFAGPNWGHAFMLPTSMGYFLQASYKWVSETTVHWYRAKADNNDSVYSLLDEDALQDRVKNIQLLAQTSETYNKRLRIAESNTISNSGLRGVSDVLGAALWLIDSSFEIANAGCSGINYHWGAGQNLYTSLLRRYDRSSQRTPAGVRPPYYANVFIARALAAGVHLLDSSSVSGPPNVKVWPLRDAVDGRTLHIVIINKPGFQGTNVVLRMLRGSGYGVGVLLRLTGMGRDPLHAQGANITLGGQTYGPIGFRISGDMVYEQIAPKTAADRTQLYQIYMPPGSAALATIQMQ